MIILYYLYTDSSGRTQLITGNGVYLQIGVTVSSDWYNVSLQWVLISSSRNAEDTRTVEMYVSSLSVGLEGRSVVTHRNFWWFWEVQDWTTSWNVQDTSGWYSGVLYWHLQETWRWLIHLNQFTSACHDKLLLNSDSINVQDVVFKIVIIYKYCHLTYSSNFFLSVDVWHTGTLYQQKSTWCACRPC